jgi:hypothetical protein
MGAKGFAHPATCHGDPMHSASPFQETETESCLRIEWDNRRIRSDGCTFLFFLVFSIIWIPMTVLATGCLFVTDNVGLRLFLAIWLIFGWGGTLGIIYSLVGRSWREWVEISEYDICHGQEGFLAPKPRTFPLDTVLCIFFGHCGDETPVTLSIFRVPGRLGLRNRFIIAYWLAPALKKQLFDRLEAFVRERSLPLEMSRGYRERYRKT